MATLVTRDTSLGCAATLSLVGGGESLDAVCASRTLGWASLPTGGVSFTVLGASFEAAGTSFAGELGASLVGVLGRELLEAWDSTSSLMGSISEVSPS